LKKRAISTTGLCVDSFLASSRPQHLEKLVKGIRDWIDVVKKILWFIETFSKLRLWYAHDGSRGRSPHRSLACPYELALV
jgi:hypothetical protein